MHEDRLRLHRVENAEGEDMKIEIEMRSRFHWLIYMRWLANAWTRSDGIDGHDGSTIQQTYNAIIRCNGR